MRPLWKDVLAALWLGVLLPGLVLQIFVLKQRHTPPPDPEPTESQGLTLLVQHPGGVEETMELGRYLTGVLLAEIPASFSDQALKAQAVAARTYAWKTCTQGSRHEGSVCTDHTCCQAYLAEQDYLDRGGREEDLCRIRAAVEETAQYVLMHEGELIEAVYFSSSGGETESAMAVWGRDFPYLQSVPSPGEEESRHHRERFTFSREALEDALGVTLSGEPAAWAGPVSHTEGGGVAEIELMGKTFTGTELRTLLQLPSTAFTLEPEEDGLSFLTRGWGHRVGLSQYGANAMAQAGSTWQQILQHYYPGTTIAPIC